MMYLWFLFSYQGLDRETLYPSCNDFDELEQILRIIFSIYTRDWGMHMPK